MEGMPVEKVRLSRRLRRSPHESDFCNIAPELQRATAKTRAFCSVPSGLSSTTECIVFALFSMSSSKFDTEKKPVFHSFSRGTSTNSRSGLLKCFLFLRDVARPRMPSSISVAHEEFPERRILKMLWLSRISIMSASV